MALNMQDKEVIVAEVAKVAAKAHSAIAAEYRGLKVSVVNQLRAEARKAGIYMRVVKNTLARRAVANTQFECMQPVMVGPIILAFAQEDPGAVARVLGDFAKKNDKFVIKGIALSGRLLAPTDLERVASLPTREQALSTLMAVMKAPITKLVRTLAEPHAKLVRTVAAVRDSKEQQAAA